MQGQASGRKIKQDAGIDVSTNTSCGEHGLPWTDLKKKLFRSISGALGNYSSLVKIPGYQILRDFLAASPKSLADPWRT